MCCFMIYDDVTIVKNTVIRKQEGANKLKVYAGEGFVQCRTFDFITYGCGLFAF